MLATILWSLKKKKTKFLMVKNNVSNDGYWLCPYN